MQRTAKKAILILLLLLPVLLGLGYFGLISYAPESSTGSLGPVILDASGPGYDHGDVVWLTDPISFDSDDIILYDWRKETLMGMGPGYSLKRYGDLTANQKVNVFAKICCKLGHNRSKAKELGSRVY